MSPGSSSHFVVSAIIVADANETRVRHELASLRGRLRRHPGQVLHFRKLTHSQKIKAAQELATFSVAVTSSIICKGSLGQPRPAGNLAYISQPDPMYLWALRLVLERISWYVREHGQGRPL